MQKSHCDELSKSYADREEMPKKLCPEPIRWTIHILNRSPTLAVKDMTP